MKHFRRVAATGNAVQGMTDDALFVDDESGAHRAPAHDAVHFLVLQHAIGLAGRVFLVGQQAHADAVFVAKFTMFDAVVARHPEHRGAQLGEVVFQFGKLDRLGGAARRVVAHVKKQHEVFPPKLGRLDDIHVRVGVGKTRRAISCLQHAKLYPIFFGSILTGRTRSHRYNYFMMTTLPGGLSPSRFLHDVRHNPAGWPEIDIPSPQLSPASGRGSKRDAQTNQ